MVVPQPRRRGRPPTKGLADRRRKEIVEAAFAVFTDRGYEQSTIADIAREAGMGLGTVYRYVDSKRDVLDRVFDYAVQRVVGSLEPDELVASASGADGAVISEIGTRLYTFIDREPALAKLLTLQAPSIDKELKQRALGLTSMVDVYLTRALSDGRDAGWVTDDAEFHAMLTRLLPALIIPGFLLQNSRHDNPHTRERFVATAAHLAATGVLRGSVPRSPRASVAGVIPQVDVGDESVADRRNELLDGALTCFIRDGYHVTGVDEIVAELGVSHGTFYNYYRSKRDALDALIEREFTRLEPALPRAGDHPAPVGDVEHVVAQGMSHLLQAAAQRAAALSFIGTEAPGVDAEAFAAVHQFFRFAASRCEQYLVAVIGADRLHRDVDNEFLGQAYLSLIVGALTVVVDPDQPQREIGAVAAHTAGFLLYGVDRSGT